MVLPYYCCCLSPIFQGIRVLQGAGLHVCPHMAPLVLYCCRYLLTSGLATKFSSQVVGLFNLVGVFWQTDLIPKLRAGWNDIRRARKAAAASRRNQTGGSADAV